MYDAVQMHMAVGRIVTRESGVYRKYYRFRPARWYGGIVTADAVGCGLICKFCWTSDFILRGLLSAEISIRLKRFQSFTSELPNGKVIISLELVAESRLLGGLTF